MTGIGYSIHSLPCGFFEYYDAQDNLSCRHVKMGVDFLVSDGFLIRALQAYFRETLERCTCIRAACMTTYARQWEQHDAA